MVMCLWLMAGVLICLLFMIAKTQRMESKEDLLEDLFDMEAEREAAVESESENTRKIQCKPKH